MQYLSPDRKEYPPSQWKVQCVQFGCPVSDPNCIGIAKTCMHVRTMHIGFSTHQNVKL